MAQDHCHCLLSSSKLHSRGFSARSSCGPACCLGIIVVVEADNGPSGRYLRRSFDCGCGSRDRGIEDLDNLPAWAFCGLAMPL